ncbi:MAG TPA: hypothetical protein VGP07_26145 [Polyangia bacterium]
MRKGIWPARALIAAVVLAGCGTTTAVRPLGAGNADVHVSIGGPLVRVSGTPVATPIAMVGAASASPATPAP